MPEIAEPPPERSRQRWAAAAVLVPALGGLAAGLVTYGAGFDVPAAVVAGSSVVSALSGCARCRPAG